MTTTTDPLKPCPFCGKAQSPQFYDRGEKSSYWFVSCNGEDGEHQVRAIGDTEAEAIAEWNARLPSPRGSDEEVERVARALANADGVQQGNHYALNAYNAGVDMTIDYWNDLARAALQPITAMNPSRVGELEQTAARAIESSSGNPDTFKGKVSQTALRDAKVAVGAMLNAMTRQPAENLFCVLVEGLHAQIFGVHSLGDPELSHKALADGGSIHEAAHALLRALPPALEAHQPSREGEDVSTTMGEMGRG